MLLTDLYIRDSHDAQGESLNCPGWWEGISGERDWKCVWGSQCVILVLEESCWYLAGEYCALRAPKMLRHACT